VIRRIRLAFPELVRIGLDLTWGMDRQLQFTQDTPVKVKGRLTNLAVPRQQDHVIAVAKIPEAPTQPPFEAVKLFVGRMKNGVGNEIGQRAPLGHADSRQDLTRVQAFQILRRPLELESRVLSPECGECTAEDVVRKGVDLQVRFKDLLGSTV
jgi:hypothetical protein